MLDGIVKADISTTAFRQVTLAHMARHSYSLKLYTDGSKNDNGTAFAVWQHHVLEAKKLPKIYSIYTAELSAILEAVEVAGHSERHRQVTIFSDSKSPIQRTFKYNNLHSIVSNINDKIAEKRPSI